MVFNQRFSVFESFSFISMRNWKTKEFRLCLMFQGLRNWKTEDLRLWLMFKGFTLMLIVSVIFICIHCLQDFGLWPLFQCFVVILVGYGIFVNDFCWKFFLSIKIFWGWGSKNVWVTFHFFQIRELWHISGVKGCSIVVTKSFTNYLPHLTVTSFTDRRFLSKFHLHIQYQDSKMWISAQKLQLEVKS